jgi:wobble nucleotide-excising tRNase
MIERITKNEERLDRINNCIKQMEEALSNMKFIQKDLALLNKYYGSKNWFKDKEAYEQGKIPKIKAGVLSEDAIWNMNEEYKDLIVEMKEMI